MIDFMFISTNDWTPSGGSEVLWSKTASLLARKGYNVDFYAKYWTKPPKHYDELRNAGCRIEYRYNRYKKINNRYQRKINTILKFNIFKEVDLWEKYFEKSNPKLLIISLGNQNSGLVWGELARRNDIPYVIIVQLTGEASVPEDSVLRKVRSFYLNAKSIIFCSYQNKSLLEKELAAKIINYIILFNPVPFNISIPSTPKVQDNLKVAFLASLSSNHKGHDLLFEVISSQKWQKRNIQFNLYGEGPHSNYIRDLAKFYKLDNVEFLGYVESKNKIWSENHAFILPSRMEGMSLALLEAIAYGRVPIVTDVGGAREIIKDNETGFIARAVNVEFIDEVLERAWQRRDEWEKMGKKGAEHLKNVIPFDPVKKLSEELVSLLK